MKKQDKELVPYSTVISACQGSGLACTRTISILRTLTT